MFYVYVKDIMEGSEFLSEFVINHRFCENLVLCLNKDFKKENMFY